MEICKGYTTSDVLFDIPYEGMNMKLYSVLVKEYKEFEKYIKYFIFSKKHYKLDNNTNLFEFILAVGVSTYEESYKKKKVEITRDELLDMVIKEFENAFSIICRDKIVCNEEALNEGEIAFTNEDNSIRIGRNNFEMLRQIILKQNALKEPKIFENVTEERLAEKYMKALERKRNGDTISELGEMANLVSCDTGKSYEDLYNQNIMQLYADYFRCISIQAYKTTTLFATVSDKVTPQEYNEEIISKLFADPLAGMWKDKSSFGFLN